ncbi:FAD binding domain-containing protein [Chloroflexota bacterium]
MGYIRRLPKFEYMSPGTLIDVCSLLVEHNGKAAVLAGGTDLLLQMKQRDKTPQYLITLKNIPGLNEIVYDDKNGLQIGALVTIRDIQKSPVIQKKFTALAQAADNLATPQIRNLATLGGNICNAAPCADMIPPLLAMGAKLKLVSKNGDRTIPLEEFHSAPFKTVQKSDELLVSVSVPNQSSNSKSAYVKYTFRGAMEYPYVAIAVVLTLDGNICKEVRITGSSCSHCWRKGGCKYRCPTPFRAKEAEKIITGKTLDDALIKSAAKTASEEIPIIVDREYKREIINVLIGRAISKAWHGTE